MRTALLVLGATLVLSIGNAFLSHGMHAIDTRNILSLPGILAWFKSVATNGWVLFGVFLEAVFFVLFLVALANANLSYVMPITACSYVFAAIIARLFLDEEISGIAWLGIGLIVLGVAIVMVGQKQMTPMPPEG